MKRTFQPNFKKSKRKHGFLKRIQKHRSVLNRRRYKNRTLLSK